MSNFALWNVDSYLPGHVGCTCTEGPPHPPRTQGCLCAETYTMHKEGALTFRLPDSPSRGRLAQHAAAGTEEAGQLVQGAGDGSAAGGAVRARGRGGIAAALPEVASSCPGRRAGYLGERAARASSWGRVRLRRPFAQIRSGHRPPSVDGDGVGREHEGRGRPGSSRQWWQGWWCGWRRQGALAGPVKRSQAWRRGPVAFCLGVSGILRG